MNKSNKFSPEVRERAVRMVLEHCGEYPSLWAAVESMALKIGCAADAAGLGAAPRDRYRGT
jgi:transposase